MDPELDDFVSERATPFVGTRPTTVGEVLAARVPLHWDEAVAVLQELIDRTMSLNRDDIPSFDDVEIAADGALTIRGTKRGERGPLAAGRALHALLATTDVPVALRLFVTQANVPETHASLAAFAKALAYFGKSDRAELIRAIHARYSATNQKPGTAATVTPPPIPSPPPAAPDRAARHAAAAALARRGLMIAAVFLAVAIAVLAGVQLLPRIMRSDATPPASAAVATPATAPTHPAARPHASKPTSASNVKSTAAADVKTTPASAAKPDAVQPRPSQAGGAEPSAPARREPRISNLRSTRVEPTPTTAAPPPDSPRGDPALAASLGGVFAPATSSISPAAPLRALADRGSDAIYSREDADVQPPVMLYPQLPPPLVLGAPSDGFTNRMELVVAPDGSVERVRLVGAPRRMSDMMLLSGAKVWKFTPAYKNGVPVRYRTTVSWTVFP